MNSIIRDHYETFSYYQSLRDQMMGLLSDADLAFTPGGANPPLGELCRVIGEVQTAYIASFRTFTLDFGYRHPDPSIARSVARLSQWYGELDAELRQVVEGLSDEDVQGRLVQRGPEFQVLPHVQLLIYQEALLIFYGKASVYLKALGKQLPEQWRAWIA
jgi:hypothetical protein